jgi:hypothetical protein
MFWEGSGEERKDIKIQEKKPGSSEGIVVRIKQGSMSQRLRKIALCLVLEDDVKLRIPGNHIHNPRKNLLLTLL